MENLKYLFGPAPSRRLGRSLGVNVVPSKICSMDCIYCEAGRTKMMTLKRSEYSPADDIISEFRDNFEKFRDITDVITVTGAGEPTLNSRLGYILDGIREYSAGKPVAILTNSSMLFDRDVFDTLLRFDIVVPSLDAVMAETMRKIDRIHKDLIPLDIKINLVKFCNAYKGTLLLEVLLCEGINDSEKDMFDLASLFHDVRITKLQLGTVTRPPAGSGARPVSRKALEKAAEYLVSKGIPAEITGSFSGVKNGVYNNGRLYERITALLKLRPCTVGDIAGVFGVSAGETEICLKYLMERKEIVAKSFNGEDYYSHVSLDALKDK